MHRISIRETNCNIDWIEIYPIDSVIHLLNNWGQLDSDLSSGQRFSKRLNNQALRNKPLVSAFVTRRILSSRELYLDTVSHSPYLLGDIENKVGLTPVKLKRKEKTLSNHFSFK